ncbi:ankyrin repeat-containing domain protein [Tribonema minus]|uniref:Ankyrin repeat-containing domain protein n=1 Tax=Tribonema minus TaxID=303371 RepID=A0A835YNI0_9STRA|nr:ankyrin repeat-containing domain protein [Tribonema minus]
MTAPTAKQVCDAAKAGDVAKLRELQLAGADINAQNEDGDVALLLAAQGGFHEAVRWLCMAGAKKDVMDKHVGATPMLFACIEGASMVVNGGVLLDGGADVSARDKSGRTALMFAAELGHPELVQWCLEFKSDPAAADVNGTTPLHYAAKGGHVDVVKALIEGGAALNAVNAKGSNAMHFAASGSSVQVSSGFWRHSLHVSGVCARALAHAPLLYAHMLKDVVLLEVSCII